MDLISYAIACLRKEFVLYGEEELRKLGLTKGLLFFILYIQKNPGCKLTTMASHLGMDMGHTTRSIAKLTEMGIVDRRVSAEDKRAWNLFLTAEGERLYIESRGIFQKWDDEVAGILTDDEQQQLKALLTKVLNNRLHKER